MRITTGSDAVIPSPVFVAADGVTLAATSSLPTVTATRDDGTAVTVGTVVAGTTAGNYTVPIAASQLVNPDVLTLTWAGTVGSAVQARVQEIEVVSGVYVGLYELWNLRDMPVTKMTTTDVLSLRDEFEDLAERYNGHAWVQRFARATVDIHCQIPRRGWRYGTVLLAHMLPVRVLSAISNVDQSTIDTSKWQLTNTGLIEHIYLTDPSTIRYVHGSDAPPARIVQACKDFVRSKALERFGGNRIGRDVLSATDPGGGSIRYSTADWDAGRPTGLLDVDAALNAYGSPLPGMA